MRRTALLFMPTLTPTHEDITQRARELWESKGSPQGQDDEIWLEAEQQLSRAPKNSSSGTVSEAESDHAKNEQQAENRKEAMAPQTPRKTAPKAKPAPSGKPIWSVPHASDRK